MTMNKETLKAARHWKQVENGQAKPEAIELWDAINQVVAASGGSTSCTNVARQHAVVRVDRAVTAIVASALAGIEAATAEPSAEVGDDIWQAIEQLAEAAYEWAESDTEPDSVEAAKERACDGELKRLIASRIDGLRAEVALAHRAIAALLRARGNNGVGFSGTALRDDRGSLLVHFDRGVVRVEVLAEGE